VDGEEEIMKTKQPAKPALKAKTPTRKSGVEDLTISKRKAKDVKGGALRSGR
jgi:hypothetical protein